MTGPEIKAKVDREGGVPEAITGYGLKSSELPEDAPIRVQAAWRLLENIARKAIEVIEAWLETLEDYEDD